MRNIVLVIVFAALVPAAATPQGAKQADAYSAEDRAVLTAVIDHTIRPMVQKVTGRPSPVVFIIDHTAPFCDRLRDPRIQPFCMFGLTEGQPSVFDATGTDFYPLFAKVVPSSVHRAALVASIRARNVERQVTPVPDRGYVELAAAPPVIETPSGPASPIYTVFSLPGYSSAGHAVATGFIDCGEKCGGGVFQWLLEKHGANWIVRVRDMSLLFDTDDPDFNRAVIYSPTLSK